jgi:hypothetical protein
MSKWSAAYRDSRWQKKRLEVMERDRWSCTDCGDGDGDGVTLNVHHIYYEAGRAPWEYENEMLVTRCEICHERMHELQKILLVAINTRETPVSLIKTLIGYAHGSWGPPVYDDPDYNTGYAAAHLRVNDFCERAICNASVIMERRAI